MRGMADMIEDNGLTMRHQTGDLLSNRLRVNHAAATMNGKRRDVNSRKACARIKLHERGPSLGSRNGI